MSSSRFTLSAFALIALAALALPSAAQPVLRTGTAKPGAPCCSITAIDAKTGAVTARTLSTGKTFQFRADVAPASGFSTTFGFQPVDGFTSAASFGPVGFQPVDGARLLGALQIGQKIWADLNGRVSLNGSEPCCGIVARIIPLGTRLITPQFSYASDSTAHVGECNDLAASSMPAGHKCVPQGTMISSGTKPDGSDATYSWTCVCS